LVSIAIVGMIVAGTWGLLREAVDMTLDAAPPGADMDRIEAFLREADGVTDVHDLHVWALSTTEVALTAHLVRPGYNGQDAFYDGLSEALRSRFGVGHATFQIETTRGDHCPAC
jgi:cobalt-zinc-cadmium efflux system protein